MKIVVIVVKQLSTRSQMNLIVDPRSDWAGIPGRMSAEGKFDAYTLMKVWAHTVRMLAAVMWVRNHPRDTEMEKFIR